jgi:hypothetical protein
MKDNQQIAAASDLRVRQLSVQNLSDSALIEQMFGYAASLHRLWASTADDELVALCRKYPGFVRSFSSPRRAKLYEHRAVGET